MFSDYQIDDSRRSFDLYVASFYLSIGSTKYDSVINFDVFVRLNAQNVFISLSSFNEYFRRNLDLISRYD